MERAMEGLDSERAGMSLALLLHISCTASEQCFPGGTVITVPYAGDNPLRSRTDLALQH